MQGRRKIEGMVTIALSSPGTSNGSTNRTVWPEYFTHIDGKVFLQYRARKYDGDGLTDKSYYVAADKIQPRSMERLIDIHNAYCQANGISDFCGEWTKATNKILLYNQMEKAA